MSAHKFKVGDRIKDCTIISEYDSMNCGRRRVLLKCKCGNIFPNNPNDFLRSKHGTCGCDSTWGNARGPYSREYKMWYRARKRAKDQGLKFDIEPSDIVIPYECPLLGIRFIDAPHDSWHSPSLDRIKPELGYTKGNIAVVSTKANAIKSNATPNEMRRLADSMYMHYHGSRPEDGMLAARFL